MNAFAVTQSIGGGVGVVPACQQCGAVARINGQICVSCLLRTGLSAVGATDDRSVPADSEGERRKRGRPAEEECLDALLAQIEMRDSDWRFGNYQILEEIGRGGMGVIYRARQRHSKRIVALKRLLGYHGDSRETLERFRREAEAAASLDHPNILPIYEVGEEEGLPFFTMKYAAGGSLQHAATLLRDQSRECVRLVMKVTRAVSYAHGEGILHRDIKPGNILLDGRGEPMVSDFGLAKWLDRSTDLTRTLTVFGTPGYIAPEQAHASAAQLTPASDIYSLGAVLFDLMAGRAPFLGDHALSVIKQAEEKPAPKLRSLVRHADRDLETICAKCLEREPKLRYRSASDLAEDLQRWLEGRPIVARPVSPPVKVWRWTKRNPKLAVSIATSVIVTCAGVREILSSSQLSSIVRQAENARHSVAIVPFEDLNVLSRRSDLARQVTGALGDMLTHTRGIERKDAGAAANVADPWKSEDWKKLGSIVGARVILSGSIRQRNNKQRIVIHLIESATGLVLRTWLADVASSSEALGGPASELSRLLANNDLAGQIATEPQALNAVTVQTIGDSNNAIARSYYDKGRELFFRYNLADQKRAIQAFEKAVEIDPSYARAYAMLAATYRTKAQAEPLSGWLAKAEAAASTALRLAPMLPEAHRAYAGSLRLKGQVHAATDAYLTAYELDPSDGRAAAAIGNIYDFAGRPDLAISWYEKASRRENRPVYADDLGEAWADLGEYDEAEKAFKLAADFRPDLSTGALGLSRLALFRGDYESARRQANDAHARYADDPQSLMMAALIEFFSRNYPTAEQLYEEVVTLERSGGVNFPGAVRFLSALGYLRHRAGDEVAATALLEEALTLDQKDIAVAPDNPTPFYSLAATEAALGQTEPALSALQRAIAIGWIDYQSMKLDPRFDGIRNSRGFQDCLSFVTRKVDQMRRDKALLDHR